MSVPTMAHHPALKSFWAGQFSDAISQAQAALKLNPEDGVLWQVLGTALWYENDFVEALAALESASAFIPLEPLARLAMGQCYAHAGHYDLARTTLGYLAEARRCPVGLLPRLAASLGELGDDAIALDVCFTLTDYRPDYHPAWFGIAYYLAKLGDPLQDRVRYLRRAHDLAPKAIPYRVALAAILFEIGSVAEAAELLTEVPAESVTCSCCLSKMSRVLEQAGHHSAALACRQRLPQLRDPGRETHFD